MDPDKKGQQEAGVLEGRRLYRVREQAKNATAEPKADSTEPDPCLNPSAA